MHRASEIQVDTSKRGQDSVTWDGSLSQEEWLQTQPVGEWKDFFEKNGYLKVENLISTAEIEKYKDIYQRMLDGDIDTTDHRHDLGNHVERTNASTENICQIMWPSLYVNGLGPEGMSPIHSRALAVARHILGDDMAFDFDMLIYKAPHGNIETPWHQDQGYWPDMEDDRASSCWVALDEATVENGCMWFVPGSHNEGVRPHHPVTEGKHVLTCDVKKEEGLPVPLKPGSCTFHHGRTAHHTGPNVTATKRRAYIVNNRPQAMVEYERNLGYDHGKKGLSGTLGTTKSHDN